MPIEFALHLFPALRPSIQVNANLIWECLVDYSGGLVCCSFGHVVRLNHDCVGI